MCEIKILGIDPGLQKTGWGVIRKDGYNLKFIDCGVIKTSATDSMEVRLSYIFDQITELINTFNPKQVAMEEVFVNVNPSSSEKLIMARTAAFLAISKSGFLIQSFRPNEVKKNITGSGHASKELVYTMVQKILNTKILTNSKIRTLDSMDALAIAMCCAYKKQML